MSDYPESLFLAVSALISVVKQDFEEFLPDTITLCSAYLTDAEPSYRESAIEPVSVVLRALAMHVGPNFRPYAAHFLGPLVSALVLDSSPGYGVSKCVLNTFEDFGGLFAHYSLIVLPALVAVIENAKVPTAVRVSAMEAMGKLIHVYDNIPPLLSSIVHPLVRVFGTSRGEDSCLGTADALVIQAAAVCAPENFKYFVPVAAKALLTNPQCRDSAELGGLEAALLRGSRDVASNILERSILSEDEFKELLADLEAASRHVILSADVGAFAKALRYKESEYLSCTTTNDYPDIIGHNGGLIEIYGKLSHTV